MSRSLGLREDRREAQVLVTLILGWLPEEPRWRRREQASSRTEPQTRVGERPLAVRPERPA